LRLLRKNVGKRESRLLFGASGQKNLPSNADDLAPKRARKNPAKGLAITQSPQK